MKPRRNRIEPEILERVQQYRQHCQQVNTRAFDEEAQRQRLKGKLFFEGIWIPSIAGDEVAKRISKAQVINFIELHVLLGLLFLLGLGIFYLFSFLFMP